MSLLNSQSFNDNELSNGFHLLTESSDTVKVNTPPVSARDAHLYPRLAGSNWTSYLTIPNVILGRSTTTPPSSKRRYATVDVDFGSSKAISRRHCEIRFSMRRDRWEIYVYGRNGIRINHALKKPHDKPAVLKTGDLIEINQTSFVFILPNSFIKPRYPSQIESAEFEVNTPNDGESNVDSKLETEVMQLFKQHMCLNTMEIVDQLRANTDQDPDINKDTILQLLVLSSKFHLAPTSVTMTSKESDAAKWVLISDSLKTPGKDYRGLPAINESPEERLDKENASIRKLFEHEDNDWSVMAPDSPPSTHAHGSEANELDDDGDEEEEEEDVSTKAPTSPPPPPPPSHPPSTPDFPASHSPVLFKSLSIESIYTTWNSQSTLDMQHSPEESRPGKRFKPSHSHQEIDSSQDPVDIYKEVRTRVIGN